MSLHQHEASGQEPQAARQILDRLAGLGVHAPRLVADSRHVRRGDVFLAYPGASSDGRRHIGQALQAGAAAVLWERAGWDWRMGADVPQIGVEHLRELAGHLADLAYGRPSAALWCCGVTGTNGKTSVTQWIAAALGALGRPCAVIGTLGSGFPDRLEAGLNTTPDALSVHAQLERFRREGARACAMEVSSIGLDQGRVNGVAFDTAVLTNLTRDHLEYHGSMDAYAQAKARLFAAPGLRRAVLNLDDPFGSALAAGLKGTALKRIGFALGHEGRDSQVVDELYRARDLQVTARGIRFVAETPAGDVSIESALLGRFNVSNLLAVLASLVCAGVAVDAAAAQLDRLVAPAGRLQRQGGEGRPLVVVDYAHTPDALEQVLTALREAGAARGGRLVCVFGCGGERDPGKRPEMGEVALRLADRVVVTSDNPRGEEPGAIIEQIVMGAGRGAEVIEDRAAAIRAAVAGAAAADVVLVAGKGHETYQEVAGVRHPFSDAQQAAQALAAWKEPQR